MREVPFNKFDDFIKNDKLRARIAERLRRDNPRFANADQESLDRYLQHCDKTTFTDLAKKNLSLIKFKNKIWQCRTDVKYTCFDDIAPDLYEGY